MSDEHRDRAWTFGVFVRHSGRASRLAAVLTFVAGVIALAVAGGLIALAILTL